jgi:mono/diheme cytochrome c family protein
VAFVLILTLGLLTMVASFADLPDGGATLDQVERGRLLVLHHDCGFCHAGGKHDPGDPGWLAGFQAARDEPRGIPFQIGDFKTYPRNLTPDTLTGLGRIAPRQIFNALRYGLKPGDTPDVVITSNTPGQGNFPANPHYLAPPMPWITWRHMSDEELWAIVAYLKHGIKPVNNKVKDSEGPPDFWASAWAPEIIGPYPIAPYPLASEEFKSDGTVTLEQVKRGRTLLLHHACSDCHNNGPLDPNVPNWLANAKVGENHVLFELGPFKVYPRNLTPDPTTGVGRYTTRQIFNALRYGLKPSETPDVVVTSNTPGQGNFPAMPHYLAPAMPWASWRHMSDDELWAIAAYLKHGIKPVNNKVPDSDSSPDFWASDHTPEKVGVYPALPFPLGNEEFKP